MGTGWGLQVSYPSLSCFQVNESSTGPGVSLKEVLPDPCNMTVGLETVNLPTVTF